MKKVAPYLLILMTFSCVNEDETQYPSPTPAAHQYDESIDGTNCGGGVSMCAWNPCSDVEVLNVAWIESTELHVTPEEVFGPLAGSCQTTLTWNAVNFDLTDIEPRSGESEVKVTVGLNERSARFIRPTVEDPESKGCKSSLEIDAYVTVRTDDGVFDDAGNAVIKYGTQSGIIPFTISNDLTNLGGTFAVTLSGNETDGSISYRLDGANQSCSGEVTLNINEETGGMGQSTSGQIGSWSSTPCPMGQSPVRLDVDAIEAIWNDVSFEGLWDDGQTAELNIDIDVKDDVTLACKENLRQRVVVPGQVTYGTSDGRIKQRTAETSTIWVSFDDTGEVLHTECDIDDTIKCATANDDIDYTLNRCSVLESVTVQIGISRNEDETSFSDEGVMIFEHHRDGTASALPDKLRILQLENINQGFN